MDFKPFLIEFSMLGTTPLNDEALFTELLDVIESYPEFSPQFWSLEVRGKISYNRDNIVVKTFKKLGEIASENMRGRHMHEES